jgi:hypothetical protein
MVGRVLLAIALLLTSFATLAQQASPNGTTKRPKAISHDPSHIAASAGAAVGYKPFVYRKIGKIFKRQYYQENNNWYWYDQAIMEGHPEYARYVDANLPTCATSEDICQGIAISSRKPVAPKVGMQKKPVGQAVRRPQAASCDTGNMPHTDDPEGIYQDSGPLKVVNKCECVAIGIRVVGVREALYQGVIPAIFLQIFNTSGQRRSIQSDVQFRDQYGNTHWETTNVFILRADERVGLQAIKQVSAYDEAKVQAINVLSCGG